MWKLETHCCSCSQNYFPTMEQFSKFGVNFSFGSELKTQPTWRQDGSQEQICKAKKFYTLDNTTTTVLRTWILKICVDKCPAAKNVQFKNTKEIESGYKKSTKIQILLQSTSCHSFKCYFTTVGSKSVWWCSINMVVCNKVKRVQQNIGLLQDWGLHLFKKTT